MRKKEGTSVNENGEVLTMSVRAMAKQLGINRNLAYRAVAQGLVPHLRFGKRIVIPKAALIRLVEEGAFDRMGEASKE